jgi:hypothetical protein
MRKAKAKTSEAGVGGPPVEQHSGAHAPSCCAAQGPGCGGSGRGGSSVTGWGAGLGRGRAAAAVKGWVFTCSKVIRTLFSPASLKHPSKRSVCLWVGVRGRVSLTLTQTASLAGGRVRVGIG